MFYMLFQGIRIYYNIIQVYVHENSDIHPENVIHECLVHCGHVAITLLDNQADHVPVGRGYSRARYMLRDYPYLFIGVLSIDGRPVWLSGYLPQDSFHIRHWR